MRGITGTRRAAGRATDGTRRAGGQDSESGLQTVQLFAGLETHGFAGGDAYLSAGAGIAADAGLAGANAEDAEAAQFEALAGREGLFKSFENRIHSRFSLGARQAGALNHLMNDVLLDQWSFLALRVFINP